MPLSNEEWHNRFCQQARWTEPLRAHFFNRKDVGGLERILEVGCGTGAISSAIARERSSAKITGVDVDIHRLEFARSHDPNCAYLAGDGTWLPFATGAFDLVLCHFLLLWIPSPARALREMARVARPGGWVIALAEPDYTGRIDYPHALGKLGAAQTAALARQGADPGFGRRLVDVFTESGLTVVESGVLRSQDSSAEPTGGDSDLEWKILREDIGAGFSEPEWVEFRKADSDARRIGDRVLFVPTFYCFARRMK